MHGNSESRGVRKLASDWGCLVVAKRDGTSHPLSAATGLMVRNAAQAARLEL